MNRTIRNLIVAAPLATIALTLVPVGAANAGPNGPVIINQPNGGDPEPIPDLPIAIPDEPKGPQDKAPLPPKPQDPQDKAPKPQSQGGNDVVVPQDGTAQDNSKETTADTKVAEVVSAKGSPDSIDRSDSLFVAEPAETTLVAADSDNGMDLTWLLVGGGLVTVSGVAFAVAVRKRSSNN